MTSLAFAILLAPLMAGATSAAKAGAVVLPDWKAPVGGAAVAFQIGGEPSHVKIWGGGSVQRAFFDDLLTAVFERTLVLEKFESGEGRIEWVFTGDRGGFTVTVDGGKVALSQRFYDSPAFNLIAGKTPRHPEWVAPQASCAYRGALRAVTVKMDHKLGLSVLLNGQTVLEQECLLDVSRHQVRLTDTKGGVAGNMLSPAVEAVEVRVDPARRHQTMIGFGGIATPTAYAQLGPEGKRQWWDLVARYNLLIQREYPNGQRLNAAMDNWDRLADATPHYYGDNFPNGEISDFNYIRTLRRLGGKVWFEFWALPPWVGSDPDKYAAAMVRYCRVSKEKAGAPPDVVGIQNEVRQTAQGWHKMTLALRRELDKAGFMNVRIHMSDDGRLGGGLERIKAFKSSPQAWAAVDFAATHLYDYQKCFTRPDDFDAPLRQWKELAGGKPFLSTEMCINDSKYQWPTYRVALAMGQLYHKNLVLADAAALCYCWTLLNVEQPSYGWTRTLCVPEAARGFAPVASSHQLRVFGAYSRRIREGMVRVDAQSPADDLLVAAFEGQGGAATVVLMNRSTRPRRVRVAWPGANFSAAELADPFHENAATEAPAPAGGAAEVAVPPGALVTLTSAPLGKPPEGFRIEGP